ncbi:MAG: UDP-N-acetylmuramoyl-L-alanyl-D-glutamate--2,6-diaminopimelate ligase [Clostridia bacterium]|nr:UDP-N-acetylmuramoyl-L-alanyl-D-glutamate--2,6-diaminopimelate ligase [Clostridia bacterium]
MRLADLLAGVPVEGELPEIEIKGITCDSRAAEAGFLFAAIPGELTDGHRYAASAAEKGAAVILAEHATGAKAMELYCPSTRAAFQQICANFYGNPQKEMRFLGVTGTNGKTSTSQFVKSILDGLGEQAGLIGTVHNQIGSETFPAAFTTPEPHQLFALLAKMREASVKTVVMEVSSQAMDQRRVDSLHFSVAGFTNLTQDHLDYHKTMENYKEAKARLFSLADRAVTNLDDGCGREFAERFGGLTYSTEDPSADLYADAISLDVGGVEYCLHYQGKSAKIRVSTPGLFTVHNTLCAAGILLADGLSFEQVCEGLNKIPKVAGRAEVVTTDEPFTVMLDYAHTPDALENILTTIRTFAKGRVVTLFGCGGDRDRTKRPLMAKAVAKYSDYIIVTSDNPRTEDPQKILSDVVAGLEGCDVPYAVIENRKEAIGEAILNARENDVILLAGKGHEDYQVLATGKIHFDEKEIVKEYLAKR